MKANHEITQLGNHLRKLRKAKRLSIRDVRRKSGLSISFISDLERGVTNPSIITIAKLAFAYNLSLSKLFEGFSITEENPFISF